MSTQKKSNSITFRVTPWEYDLIAENALASGMTITQFLRAVGKNVVIKGDRKYQFVNRNEVLRDAN